MMAPSIHPGYTPGCIGRVAELHARYYHPLVGFGLPFEAKVARELAGFCERFDAQRDGLWFALQDGVVHGSIAIDGSHAGEDGAHLRWFITSDASRGSGIGQQLLTTAMDFCNARNYPRVYLWTFKGLAAARHLYEKHGFQMVHQQMGAQWGAEVCEQRFERRLLI
jgi:GNAT superfamily N-acetyltransferase